MNIHILTLFPDMFDEVLNESIIKRAQEKNLVKIHLYNLRDWANDKHKTVDDIPYGGGAGMIMKADIIDRALRDIKSQIHKKNSHKTRKKDIINSKTRIILTSPKGIKFDQKVAHKYSKIDELIIICGHYGGIDERVCELIDEEVSIGDFVLTGGEIPAMAIVDATIRLIPNVINRQSLEDETHSKIGQKQYPQYTKPREFKPISIKKEVLRVPQVLLSGNHEKISDWKINKIK